jgi:hypothetical protein
MTVSTSRLNNWLFRVPASAARIELRYESLSGTVALCGYARAELDDINNLADVLIEAAQDHANAVRARVSFVVLWLDAQGQTITSKPLRCSPEADEDDDIEPQLAGAGKPPKENATAEGLVAQLMRHVENRERMLNIALGTNLKLMHDQLREARQEADALRVDLRQTRNRMVEIERAAAAGGEEDTDDCESLARAEAVTKVTDAIVAQLIPLVGTKLREGLQ